MSLRNSSCKQVIAFQAKIATMTALLLIVFSVTMDTEYYSS